MRVAVLLAAIVVGLATLFSWRSEQICEKANGNKADWAQQRNGPGKCAVSMRIHVGFLNVTEWPLAEYDGDW